MITYYLFKRIGYGIIDNPHKILSLTEFKSFFPKEYHFKFTKTHFEFGSDYIFNDLNIIKDRPTFFGGRGELYDYSELLKFIDAYISDEGMCISMKEGEKFRTEPYPKLPLAPPLFDQARYWDGN